MPLRENEREGLEMQTRSAYRFKKQKLIFSTPHGGESVYSSDPSISFDAAAAGAQQQDRSGVGGRYRYKRIQHSLPPSWARLLERSGRRLLVRLAWRDGQPPEERGKRRQPRA